MKRAYSILTQTRMNWNKVKICKANIHMRVPPIHRGKLSGLKKQIIFG